MSASVTVYTTSYCPYCNAAKRFLDNGGVEYEAVDVSNDPEKRMWLVEKSGMRTVPQIFVGDESVGGFSDMEGMHRRGEFAPLLDRHGVSHKF